MIDSKKVIKGLECCIKNDPDDKMRCGECPYEGACLNRLKADALALLKAHEPIDAIPMYWLDDQIHGYAARLQSTELKALLIVKGLWEKDQEAKS